MKILISATTKQKCAVLNCKNNAEYCFAVKGRASRCYMCADCANKLANDALSLLTPKSPKNAIKRISDKREQDKNANA